MNEDCINSPQSLFLQIRTDFKAISTSVKIKKGRERDISSVLVRREAQILQPHTRNRPQGCRVWLQIGSVWPQTGQIRFFSSDFNAFGAGAPNALKSDLKKPRICPIWGPI